jgi:hypothetical protein
MTDAEHESINVQLARMETKMDIVLDEHEKRIDKLETSQGKQNMISATMSALGISIVFLAKYLFAGGKT